MSGRLRSYYEWSGAGVWRPAGAGGAMHGGRRVEAIHYGFDEERLAVRVDLAGESPGTTVGLEFLEPPGPRVEVARGGGAPIRSTAADGAPLEGAVAAWDTVCEFGVPFRALGVEPGFRVTWVVTVREGGHVVESAPESSPLVVEAPGPETRREFWSA